MQPWAVHAWVDFRDVFLEVVCFLAHMVMARYEGILQRGTSTSLSADGGLWIHCRKNANAMTLHLSDMFVSYGKPVLIPMTQYQDRSWISSNANLKQTPHPSWNSMRMDFLQCTVIRQGDSRNPGPMSDPLT